MSDQFDQTKVVGILRGISSEFFSDVMQVAFSSGLQAIEVTLNTEKALSIIGENRPRVPDGYFLGAGTVCNLDDAKKAIDSGAMFLVTPNLDLNVIEYAVSQNIPVVAGALTPTEIYQAWSFGAAMIKVFPCKSMGGPQYIKELRGPYDSIPLCAVGGVTKETLRAYFEAGANSVGVSSSLFGKAALAEQNLNQLAQNVKAFIQMCR